MVIGQGQIRGFVLIGDRATLEVNEALPIGKRNVDALGQLRLIEARYVVVVPTIGGLYRLGQFLERWRAAAVE